jgi:hypothetical protein
MLPRDDIASKKMGLATDAKASALDRKYAAKCSYDALESFHFPKCNNAKVTHTVKFADGTTLRLCATHAQWYQEVHPFTVPFEVL